MAAAFRRYCDSPLRIQQFLERMRKPVTDLRTMGRHRAPLIETFITKACLESGAGARVRYAR